MFDFVSISHLSKMSHVLNGGSGRRMSEIDWESRRVELLRIIARKDEKQILTEDASFPRAESTRQPIENL